MHHIRQRVAEEEDQQGAEAAQKGQQTNRRVKSAPGVAGIVHGDIVGHHARNSHRQARGGDGQQHIVGGIYALVDAHAVVIQHMGQGHVVQHADQLADDA